MRVRFGVLMLLACAPAMADLAQVRAEPNLEKRAHGALDNAERALKACRKAYDSGDLPQTQALLDEVKDSVSLADESLNDDR